MLKHALKIEFPSEFFLIHFDFGKNSSTTVITDNYDSKIISEDTNCDHKDAKPVGFIPPHLNIQWLLNKKRFVFHNSKKQINSIY